MTTSTPIPLRTLVWAYALALLCFLALDAVWLSNATARLYQPAIGELMATQVDVLAVAVFYPLYVAGLVYFAVVPGLQARRVAVACLRGGILGLLAYATYDLTNQATLRGWPWHITLIDSAWGTFVTGTASAVSAWVTLRLTYRP